MSQVICITVGGEDFVNKLASCEATVVTLYVYVIVSG